MSIPITAGEQIPGRYDDDRWIVIKSSVNSEVSIKIGNQTPIFVDALDFLRMVAHVVLDMTVENATLHESSNDKSL